MLNVDSCSSSSSSSSSFFQRKFEDEEEDENEDEDERACLPRDRMFARFPLPDFAPAGVTAPGYNLSSFFGGLLYALPGLVAAFGALRPLL